MARVSLNAECQSQAIVSMESTISNSRVNNQVQVQGGIANKWPNSGIAMIAIEIAILSLFAIMIAIILWKLTKRTNLIKLKNVANVHYEWIQQFHRLHLYNWLVIGAEYYTTVRVQNEIDEILQNNTQNKPKWALQMSITNGFNSLADCICIKY